MRILPVLIIVLSCFINMKESQGKSLLANDLNARSDEHNCICSGSGPLSSLQAAAFAFLVKVQLAEGYSVNKILIEPCFLLWLIPKPLFCSPTGRPSMTLNLEVVYFTWKV